MTEDEIYRSSTQYRLWSFTPKSLLSLRSKTNFLAAEGVLTAIRTAADSGKAIAKADSKEASSNGVNSSAPPIVQASQALQEVECLTVEEEQKLVGFYCIKAMEFADFCDFPTNVKVYSSITKRVFSRSHWDLCAYAHILERSLKTNLPALLGYSSAIPQKVLPVQLSHDIPPQRNHAFRPLSLYQD